jgi:regulator of cell morphogenesis and NO signaling
MTTTDDLTTDSNVGQIAAHLPGAAAVFRNNGISFCCGGDQSIAEAATRRGRDPAEIVVALQALLKGADRGAPQETADLIAHIQSRYHDTHRRELADLIPLARKVETVHGEHPDAPQGLASLLADILSEMESHMMKEEQVLFPMMLSGGNPMIVHPIAMMRSEHEGHADKLRAMEHLTHGFALPEGACRSWSALYAGSEKLAQDLVAHMHLENEILFPRFETTTG